MPDSWIDRDELASLAGELSRKRRRLPHHAARPSPARNRPQDRKGAAPQEASRSDKSVEASLSVASEAEAADAAMAAAPEVEPPEAPKEAVPEVEPANMPTEAASEAEAADAPTAAAAVPEVEPADASLCVSGGTAAPDEVASPEDLGSKSQAIPLESLVTTESPTAADLPSEEEGEDLFEREHLRRSPEGVEAREGVLTNLSIAEPDPEAVRNRTPLFLREAESLLEGAGNLTGEVDDAVALRSLAAARARADQGGLLKEGFAGQGNVKLPADPGSDPVAPPPLPGEPARPNPLVSELPTLESLFELDTFDGSDPVETGSASAEPGPRGRGAEPLLQAATATMAEPAEVPSEPADGPMAYESADESLPWRLAQFAFAFASGTGSRNVCIVDEAGYPLHEDNPELRLRSRGAELAFFPDPRLTGGSELSAAQVFLAGRWHGIIRGAAPCRHLFLRFDREDPFETAEMEIWSHHLVKTLA